MGFFFQQFQSGLSRRNSIPVLAFTWVLSILLGIVLSRMNCDVISSLMYNAAFGDMSLYGILSASCLPLIFSFFAVNCFGARFLIPIAGLYGFFQGFFGWGIMDAFGHSGWLVRLLLVFSNVLMMPLLWFFWVRSLARERVDYFGLFLLTGLLVGWIDFSFVSPFLTEILSL